LTRSSPNSCSRPWFTINTTGRFNEVMDLNSHLCATTWKSFQKDRPLFDHRHTYLFCYSFDLVSDYRAQTSRKSATANPSQFILRSIFTSIFTTPTTILRRFLHLRSQPVRCSSVYYTLRQAASRTRQITNDTLNMDDEIPSLPGPIFQLSFRWQSPTANPNHSTTSDPSIFNIIPISRPYKCNVLCRTLIHTDREAKLDMTASSSCS
jgi:hypothetical protein